MIEYIAIGIFGMLAAVIVAFMLMANRWWGPRQPSLIKSQPFECGTTPIALPGGKMPIHFYIMAMLFVAFDVELVFLFPWAVLAKDLGWMGLLEMSFFLAIIVIGFLYAWRQGVLEPTLPGHRVQREEVGRQKSEVKSQSVDG